MVNMIPGGNRVDNNDFDTHHDNMYYFNSL